jgi:hypothetical protein
VPGSCEKESEDTKLLKPGEKIHVITRRCFDGDLRRHFAGQVVAATESTARVQGYTFVFYPGPNEYVRRPDLRERIIALSDAGNIINVLPENVNLDELVYRPSEQNRLVVTDCKSFSLDINEFSGIN